MQVEVIETSELGDRSYVVHDGRVAVVIDPQRDTDRIERLLAERIDEVPSGPLWVHCASGFRASIVARILARAGHDVVLVDDEYENAAKLGLTGA